MYFDGQAFFFDCAGFGVCNNLGFVQAIQAVECGQSLYFLLQSIRVADAESRLNEDLFTADK